MAASALFSSKYRNHVRSGSMPSRSHPVKEKVEENLSQLRQYWGSNLPSTSSSSLCIINGLSGLSDLYHSIDDLLQLPQTQQTLSCSTKKKCVEVLDGSVRLLDSCGTARDVMLQMADAVKDVQLALRRRLQLVPAVKSTEIILEKEISFYMIMAKKMKHRATKCLKTLNKIEFSSLSDVGSQSQLVEVMTVLKEAMFIAINILEQLHSFVSVSNRKAALVPMKKKRSSLVLKWIGSGRVSCQEIKEDQVKGAQEE